LFAAATAVVLAVGGGVWAATSLGDAEGSGADEDPTSEPPLAGKLVQPIGDDELVVTVEGSPRTLYRVTVPDGEPELLADIGPGDAGIPAISPNRDAVYFPLVHEDQREVDLMRLDADGVAKAFGEASTTLRCQARPSWNAEGGRPDAKVAIACDDTADPEGRRVYEIPVDADGVTFVVDQADALSGSPEKFGQVQYAGEGVVISHWEPPGLNQHRPDEDQPRKLTDHLDHHPAVLRGFGEIVFERDGDLYALSLTGEFSRCGEGWMLEGLDGVPVCQLTDTEAFETRPAWSPDGRRLAYLSSDSEGGEAELQVRNVDDDPTETGVLIALPGEPVHLCWSSP
jgi:hypothetical protein